MRSSQNWRKLISEELWGLDRALTVYYIRRGLLWRGQNRYWWINKYLLKYSKFTFSFEHTSYVHNWLRRIYGSHTLSNNRTKILCIITSPAYSYLFFDTNILNLAWNALRLSQFKFCWYQIWLWCSHMLIFYVILNWFYITSKTKYEWNYFLNIRDVATLS